MSDLPFGFGFGAGNDGLPLAMGTLLRLAQSGDADTVLEGLRTEGFVRPHIEIDPEQVLSYLDPFVEPARQETFTFSRDWMRGQFTRLNDIRNPDFTVGLKLNLPPSYALIHRVWLGTIGVLCQLGATCMCHGRGRGSPGGGPRARRVGSLWQRIRRG